MTHTITVGEVEAWAGQQVWHQAACSYGNGASKQLEMSNGGMWRVTDHDKVTYRGEDIAAAVAAYNSAP